MIVQTQIQNLTGSEKEQFKELLQKKITAIQPLIQAHYPDKDTVKMDVHMQKFNKHSAFQCEFVLTLPRTHRALVAKEAKHTMTEVMDFSLAKLEGQLVKHFKKITKE